MGKLIFLTATRLDIAYVVSMFSQFMQAPRTIHLEGVYRVLVYIKRGGPQEKGYCIRDKDICQLKLTPTQVMLVIRRTISLMAAMPPMLEGIL